MKTLRALLLASAVGMSVVAAAAQEAAAPSPEAIAVAKELVALMSGDIAKDMASKMNAQVWPTIEQELRNAYPQIDAATIAELRAECEKQLLDNITEGMNDAPVIYARHLTVQEMRDIQAFYRTPTGARTLKLMPQITAEIMGNLTQRTRGMMTRVNVALTAILQKHGYATR